MPIKINGSTSGSVTLAAPATGSDVTLTLPGSTMDLASELAAKANISTEGLTLITTQALSGTSVSVNGCFTTTYDNYLILLTAFLNTSEANIRMRLRASGTDDTGSNYREASLYQGGTTVTGFRGAANTTYGRVAAASTAYSYAAINIYGPKKAQRTRWSTTSIYGDSAAALSIEMYYADHDQATAYDGFTVYPNANSFQTGSAMSIYGYGK